MMFCPKCKSILLPSKDAGKVSLACGNCGFSSNQKQNFSLKEEIKLKREDQIEVIDKKVETLPRTKDEECPKCGTKDAYYWMTQTRAADEAATRFFRCVKCTHTWREY